MLLLKCSCLVALALSRRHTPLGQVLKRDAEGTVKRVENAKVAVFAQGVDTTSTETKV